MREKLHTNRVIVVEGKYDAARLAGLTDAVILQTDGFSIFNNSLGDHSIKHELCPIHHGIFSCISAFPLGSVLASKG